MGDIFRREVAPNPEPFTGERLTSELSGQTQIEHYHRYLFARSFCAGKDVLDVASGEGYGAAQMAQVARSVIGVEYAARSVRYAAGNFPRDNLCFLQGDARALPLPDDCVDVAVSFETIEHFDRQNDFLAEIRRVLRPGGLFIVSTPDRDIYSPAHVPANQYHVRELSRAEFIALLHQRFPNLEIVLQRPMIGSVLMPSGGAAEGPVTAPLVFDRRGDTHFEACDELPRAPYVVALASDVAIPGVRSSLYVDRSDLDSTGLALAERLAELTMMRDELASAKAALEACQAASALAAHRVAALQRENDAMGRELGLARGSLRHFLQHYLPRVRRTFGFGGR